jgi:ankyrin repeat protein
LRGADPNAPDAQGKYPIHHAAATGSKAFCEILIKHKARLDMPDAEGHLPRAIAKLHKHYDLSHYLQSEAIRHKNK